MQKKLIEDVDKKMQFTAGLALFFPVLLESLFKFAKANDSEYNKVLLQWSFIIFILILTYLFFEFRKEKLSTKSLKALGWTLMFNISCYALVILFFGISTKEYVGTFSQILVFLYPVSLYGIMGSPILAIFIILFDCLPKAFKK